jgi:eukaryotic-like serine/threonine-protein kinase
MNDLLTYLKSRIFLKNLALAFEFLFIILALLIIFLRIYTHHGRSIVVPNFSDVAVKDAEKIISANHLRYEIFDSIYIAERIKGVIIDQHPKPGLIVKKNRVIYFTINASSPGKMLMPDLVGLTLREARSKIVSSGLKIGNFTYRYDMAKNVVLEQKVKGNSKDILPRDTVFKGTEIDLILGKGLSEDKSLVPNLLGLTINQAKIKASDEFFAVGAVVYDKGLDEKDTIVPHIYKQRPEHSNAIRCPLGTPIDLWVTLDSAKLAGKAIADSNNYNLQQLNEDNNNEDIEDDSYTNDYN